MFGPQAPAVHQGGVSGQAVTCDHDPLSALDEAEDDINKLLSRERENHTAASDRAPVLLTVAQGQLGHGAVSAPRFGDVERSSLPANT